MIMPSLNLLSNKEIVRLRRITNWVNEKIQEISTPIVHTKINRYLTNERKWNAKVRLK